MFQHIICSKYLKIVKILQFIMVIQKLQTIHLFGFSQNLNWSFQEFGLGYVLLQVNWATNETIKSMTNENV